MLAMDSNDPYVRSALRYGWSALLLFALGGLLLEFLHLVKAPWYLEVRIRRELWILGHAHGALLALLTLVWGYAGARLFTQVRRRRLAARTLCWGAALVPAGFLLGGIGNSETDPSLFIVLTPVGALLVLHALAATALGAWRARIGTDP